MIERRDLILKGAGVCCLVLNRREVERAVKGC